MFGVFLFFSNISWRNLLLREVRYRFENTLVQTSKVLECNTPHWLLYIYFFIKKLSWHLVFVAFRMKLFAGNESNESVTQFTEQLLLPPQAWCDSENHISLIEHSSLHDSFSLAHSYHSHLSPGPVSFITLALKSGSNFGQSMHTMVIP